jgi:hypothetical protein
VYQQGAAVRGSQLSNCVVNMLNAVRFDMDHMHSESLVALGEKANDNGDKAKNDKEKTLATAVKVISLMIKRVQTDTVIGRVSHRNYDDSSYLYNSID